MDQYIKSKLGLIPAWKSMDTENQQILTFQQIQIKCVQLNIPLNIKSQFVTIFHFYDHRILTDFLTLDSIRYHDTSYICDFDTLKNACREYPHSPKTLYRLFCPKLDGSINISKFLDPKFIQDWMNSVGNYSERPCLCFLTDAVGKFGVFSADVIKRWRTSSGRERKQALEYLKAQVKLYYSDAETGKFRNLLSVFPKLQECFSAFLSKIKSKHGNLENCIRHIHAEKINYHKWLVLCETEFEFNKQNADLLFAYLTSEDALVDASRLNKKVFAQVLPEEAAARIVSKKRSRGDGHLPRGIKIQMEFEPEEERRSYLTDKRVLADSPYNIKLVEKAMNAHEN
jgi:hypothetical protein